MRTRGNPAMIGGFVLGAIALVIGAVMLLGAGTLFRETVDLVAFFPGSVNGLSVGAPVKFKGVEIGRVTQIQLALDEAYSTDFQIPVFFELDPDRMMQHGAVLAASDLSNKAVLQELYKIGLRAQLQSESFLTGVLYVEIDIFPGTPIRLQLDEESSLREIPTLPTTFDQAASAFKQLMARLEEIDLEKLVTALNMTVNEMNSLISSPELKEAFRNLNAVLIEADDAVADIRRLADSARGNLDSITTSVRGTLDRSRGSLERIDATLSDAGKALVSAERLIEPDSPVVYQLAETLRSLEDAAGSVRRLADSLERNPSTLLYGRSTDAEDDAP